jgi:lipopolysaccharide export LptBFGC system permease protein LptF
MKRKTTILLIILCAFLTLNMDPAPCVCEGESSNFDLFLTSFIACVFYGECQPWYQYTTSEELTSLVAYGENNGLTLYGSWKGSGKDIYYILTFEEQNTLSLARHRKTDNYLLRYDRGTYSIDADNLIMDMENGTYSIVKYSISNKTLTLKMQEVESIKTVE